MRVNPHIRLFVVTLAGSLFISAPAIAAEQLFKPHRSFVDHVELSDKQRHQIEQQAARERVRMLVYPIKGGKPDYGTAEAAFGTARGRMHHGQDVFAAAGTPLVAIREGVVVEAGSDGGAGNHVAIYNREHDQTYAYFHLSAPSSLRIGEKVKAGQRVGAVGCSGSCWGDHLHFEVREGRGLWEAPSVDPLPLLRRAERSSRSSRPGA